MGLKSSQPRVVLCMDLDGTLIDQQEKAHPTDIAILNDFPQDVLLIPATGRSLPSARGVLSHNGILKAGPFPWPGVFTNGTVAQLPGETVIAVHYLENEFLPDLVELTRVFSATSFFFFQLDKVYLVNPTPIGRELSRLHYMDAIECQPDEVPLQINKAMAVEANLEIIDQIRQHTQDYPAEMGTSLPHIFEFTPPGITKAKGARALLEAMGYDSLPIYAVGDGENDLTMKGMARQFFVPSTAQQAVRNQADVVIDRAKNGILTPILDYIL